MCDDACDDKVDDKVVRVCVCVVRVCVCVDACHDKVDIRWSCVSLLRLFELLRILRSKGLGLNSTTTATNRTM